ncbi:sensor histidine kinase [Dyadobacter sp. MSC1_007]|jgi:two-component system LytT family sensor kinase|uniref:sensor histidine kinase n=1 Tax=Dyadobacter sp. MSC1_007 TaxID=2909264 RepID=UPI002030E7FE|nr:histidine kinase [Dyadobacter sp. MSC1_007]
MVTKTFRISAVIIWLSSLSLGVLVTVPKIAEKNFNGFQVFTDGLITALFTLFVWYFNIYSLPKFSKENSPAGFSVPLLIRSILIGIVLMFLMVCAQKLLVPSLNFGPVMLMFEVRGIMINLIFYMLLHLLYQTHRNQQVILELERTKADNLGAQYELLKQQVNPHFLFNSLSTLKSMVELEDRNSVDFILKLSDFYRFTLENRKLDLIPLSEEIEILDAYMYLLKARFEEGIELEYRIEDPVYQTWIPPFTLQLLVENCIKHNVVSLDYPLHITIYTLGDWLVVENPLQLKKNPGHSTEMGLDNINRRYLHLMEKKIQIETDQESFRVKLPLINENRNH